MRVFRCENIDELAEVMAASKEAERTPVIVSEAAADLTSENLVSAMEGSFE